MTTDRPTDRRPGTRDRKDDLLRDLRATVPVPAPAPAPAPATAPAPALATAPPEPVTPAVEVRVTPLRWSRPRAESMAEGAGVRFTVGPLRVSLTRYAG